MRLSNTIKIFLSVGIGLGILAVAYYAGIEKSKRVSLSLIHIQTPSQTPSISNLSGTSSPTQNIIFNNSSYNQEKKNEDTQLYKTSHGGFNDLEKEAEKTPSYQEISYKSEKFGVEFKYPKSYDEKDCGGVDEEGDCLMIGIGSGLCIKDSSNLTLNEFVAKEWGDKETLEALENLTWESIDIKGEKGIRIFYSMKGTGRPGEDIYLLKNNKIYDFSEGGGIPCTVDEKRRPDGPPVLYRIITTFKFLNNKNKPMPNLF